MTYKEALFFTGKCLTINHEEHNKKLVEEDLKNNKIDWEAIVKVSTSHYVFPALYCNFKKANFLHYIPEDLVAYMKHITDLNRERNMQIIAQAKEINDLLIANDITPVFLKGTGNLLEGLYDDIAERMVGDIDFIVDHNNIDKAFDLLIKDGYENKKGKTPDFHRHLARIISKNKVAAVEIHKELLIEKYTQEFNFEVIFKNHLTINKLNFLSYEDQLCLSIIAKQINDDGQYYNNIALRNAYDVFLLSNKVQTLEAISKYNSLFIPLNNFLAITKTVINSDRLNFLENSSSKKTIKKFNQIIDKELDQKIVSKKLFVSKRLEIIYKSFFSKEYRTWLINRITDKEWLKTKINNLKSRLKI